MKFKEISIERLTGVEVIERQEVIKYSGGDIS